MTTGVERKESLNVAPLCHTMTNSGPIYEKETRERKAKERRRFKKDVNAKSLSK